MVIKMPKVSVIIPCYNYGHFIEEAVESVLSQAMQDFEIIIVNDGSTDKFTNDLLTNYTKPKTKVIHQNNQGLAMARNNGIAKASGEYILPLDADNKITPTYLEKAVKILDNNPEIGIVYSDAIFFGERKGLWKLPDFKFENLLVCNFIDACSVVRKKVWVAVGGFDPRMPVPGYEDWDFWIGAFEAGWEFFKLSEPLFIYRWRSTSMIHNCNIPENRKLLIAYVVSKHRSSYIEHLSQVISEKDVQLLEAQRYIQKLIPTQKKSTRSFTLVDRGIRCYKEHGFGYTIRRFFDFLMGKM
jgi:glycosyltransferase involved in cell wall biosynthesis